MRNKFPGTCSHCRKPCGVDEGEATKSPFGKWRIIHDRCTDAGAATALAPAKRKPKPARVTRGKFIGLNPW